MSASMVDKQLQSPAVNNGQDFYRHTPSHDGTAETGPDVEAMDTAVASLAKAIQDEQQQLMQKSTAPRRRLPMYALPLLCLDASKLAHITLESIQTLITTRGAAGSETMCIHAAKVIGERCQRERRLDLRRGQARDVGKLLMERTNIRSRTKKQAARFDSTDWSEGYRDIHLGAKLIDLAVVYTHMLSIGWGRSRGTRRQPKIPRILRLLEHKLLPLAMPQPLPMTMKPVPWTGLGSGGYPGTEELEMELVKHRHSESAIRALKKAKLAEVFSAVNALQETPWQINKSIYSIVQRLWKEGKKIPGLPPFEPVLPTAAEQGRVLSQQNPRVLLVSRLKRYGEAALQGTRRREYVTARACVGLLQALERHSVLPNDNLAEQVSKCLDLPETEYAKDVPDHPLPSERPAPVFNRLLEYRLYEDFRLGWRITLPNLERCGLVRVYYCNLFAICQNNDLWKENMLLKDCPPEQRQQIAVGVLDYMRRSLAIDAEYPPQLKRLVRGTLKEPWTFGKKERLFTATVFIDPEVRAEWAKNEKSVSYRSWIGRFLCRQEKWRYPGCLTEEIYTGLIRRLLEALEVGGILKRVNSASGKLGFQIRVDRLQWVRGDSSPPLTSILWFPSKANRVEKSKSFADLTIMHLLMAVCEKLFSEDHFFFPHQLDYRGRAYPIPPILNPQSDDLGRALLVFADGKLLGNKGADWLAVHLANMFGYDKASFDDRVKWVHDNQDKILEFVAQPEKISQIWGDARIDKPWCFLAACLEWKGYLKKGKSYKSHLPIAMDGTCNGLQHLSAMGRDPVGSRYTNLVPGSKPEDIYQEVANRLKELVETDLVQGKQGAIDWSGKIDRKVAKRATMTTPYGVTPKGIRDQLIEDGFTAHMEDKWVSADYLTKRLTTAIGMVVVKAKEIMQWLQEVAGILADADEGVCWTAPTGFPVVVEHREHTKKRIDTVLGTLEVDDMESPTRLKQNRQKNCIAPNFVHSLDAAHMTRTVNRLHDMGLRHFAMIHDSYGVHACDVDLMSGVLRQEFVRIHEESVMNSFFNEQRQANPKIPLPSPPEQGNFDVKRVLESEYFFS